MEIEKIDIHKKEEQEYYLPIFHMDNIEKYIDSNLFNTIIEIIINDLNKNNEISNKETQENFSTLFKNLKLEENLIN